MKQHKIQEQLLLEAYDAHADGIFRHCAYRLNDRERAKELSQEAFVRAWQYLANHPEVEEVNMKALLFHIARNLIIDEYRAKRRTDQSLDALFEEEGFDPHTDEHLQIEIDAEISLVKEVLTELPDAMHEVIVLRYINDMSVKDIAELLQETENTVSVRIHRALKHLQTKMEKGTA
ncbi:MAG: RNA polymerase sigma factor [Minisyncoccota bacterium]